VGTSEQRLHPPLHVESVAVVLPVGTQMIDFIQELRIPMLPQSAGTAASATLVW
jgi:hypothetical protein